MLDFLKNKFKLFIFYLKTILKNMKQVCKCSGVSGSCSLKVCWKIMPEFRIIGNEIMKKYNLASRIKGQAIKERLKLLKYLFSKKTPKETEYKNNLIFIERSPNYCKKVLNVELLEQMVDYAIQLKKIINTRRN